MADAGGLLLGLDAGNTVIKAVLFDHTGRQLAIARRDGTSVSPAPGHVERDMRELWENASAVIGECLAVAGAKPDDVAAIGCAGHGNGLYLLDTAGAPLLAVQSLDNRAAALAGELSANGNGERLHALCGQAPWPSQTPTLLAWVKRHAPDLYARAGTAFLCKDYVTFRLTGCRVSDISDMSGCGFVRLPECSYADDLLAGYDLEDARHLLPDLVRPDEVVGYITAEAARETGLAEGTPVVGGLFDVVASALGSGVVHEGQASVIVGTWSINQVITRHPAFDPRVFMSSVFADGRVMAIEASATSAANLEWYVRELVERGGHHDDPFGHCNRLVASVTPSADNPYFHPYLYGSRLGAEMRAGFHGVAGWHGEAHLLRALFEGIAFEHRRHIEVLRSAGLRFDSAILSGGGARSPVWPQMFADILGIPISVSACAETGALGAAIVAAIGAGLFPDYEAAVAGMTAPAARFMPDSALSDHYAARYSTFGAIRAAMMPVWQHMAESRGGT